MAEDIAKMRTKLIDDDIQRHNKAEAKREEQHHEIVNILKENSASQKQVFDTLNTLRQVILLLLNKAKNIYIGVKTTSFRYSLRVGGTERK